jgi:hypothetical protein
VAKLNIIVDQAVLLDISIYIKDLRRHIVSIAIHLDVLLHRLSSTVKMLPKIALFSSSQRVVDNVHTRSSNPAMCTLWPRLVNGQQHQRFINIVSGSMMIHSTLEESL